MIGDVLVSSIICNNLRRAYPDAQIDYLVYESTTQKAIQILTRLYVSRKSTEKAKRIPESSPRNQSQ
jgi:ADP-heptose:LPS heptosyltransferase